MVWTKTGDGSIIGEDGEIIFFSTQRFLDDICNGDCCFICGAKPGTKLFNAEHVFPEWLLRRFALFSERLTLPNGQKTRYDRHTIPCCSECNSLMGEEIEQRISKVVAEGAASIQDFVAQGGGLTLYVWLGLIYLKLHLKARSFRKERNPLISTAMISDDYQWDLMHHIHTVVRSFTTPTTVGGNVLGSMLILPCHDESSADQFDFVELHYGQTMMLRLASTVIVAVFNDSGGASSFFLENVLDRITGPISALQAREIMVEFAMLNLHLKVRPEYQSQFDMAGHRHSIVAKLSDRPELTPWDFELRGKMMWDAFSHSWSQLTFAGRTEEEVKKAVLTGRLNVLFDDQGNFSGGSWDNSEPSAHAIGGEEQK